MGGSFISFNNNAGNTVWLIFTTLGGGGVLHG